MDWALLEGLGNGMQQVGGAVFKAKFLDKLKEQEAVRAEQRKQQRELSEVKESRVVPDGEGVFWKEDINKNGEVLRRDLAPKTEIDKIKMGEQKDKLTLEELIARGENAKLTNKKLQFDVDTQAEDRELTNASVAALVGQRTAQGQAALIRADKYQPGGRGGSGGKEKEPASKRDYIVEVKKQSAALFKEEGIGALEADGLAELAVNRAIIDKIDPILALKQLLKERKSGTK